MNANFYVNMLKAKISRLFYTHPILIMVGVIIIVVSVQIAYMELFRHDEVLKETMAMCMRAHNVTGMSVIDSNHICGDWVYRK